MITGLAGKLTGIGDGWVELLVGGVTLRVTVPVTTADSVGSLGDQVRLLTVLLIRDDGMTLYGFMTEEDRLVFQSLIGVNGVGPRVAVNILSGLTAEQLATAIANGDPTAFKVVQGVGTKTANRIVLEMKGKLDFQTTSNTVSPGDKDVVDALTALGYSYLEAANIVTELAAGDDLSLEEKIRLSLESIGE